MEVILFSVFSAIIVLITVYSMIKIFLIAYKREEITLGKCRGYVATSVGIGLCLAFILPYGYQILFDTFLQTYL